MKRVVGRPFPKGVSGNPGGKTGLPPELRAERRKNQGALIRLVALYCNLTTEEADTRMSGPDIPQIEEMVQGLIRRSKEGDVVSFKYLMELMIGKIPEVDDDLTDEDMRILIRAKEIMAAKKAKPVESE